jgi:hypothetical protein
MTKNLSFQVTLFMTLAAVGMAVALAGACTSSDPIFRNGEGGSPGIGGQVVNGDGGGTGGFDPGVGGSPGIGGQAGYHGELLGGAPGSGGQAGEGIGGQAGQGIGGQAGEGIGGQGIGGQAAGGAPGNAGTCDQVVTLSDCEARIDCYSVFFDPGNCGCASSGCCAHFHHCADGYAATCAGQVSCAVSAPHCESPYLVSFRSGCYEGCVHNKDCAP